MFHSPTEEKVDSYYKKCLVEDQQKSVAIATLKTLIEVLENDNSITVSQLRETIRDAIDLLKQIESSIQVESVAEIFLRFITLDVSRYDVSNFVFSHLSISTKKHS